MRRIPLASSLIHSVQYTPNSATLEISFHSGDIYHYYNVPESIYKGLVNADSPGKYYNQHIRGRFQRQKIPGEYLKK